MRFRIHSSVLSSVLFAGAVFAFGLRAAGARTLSVGPGKTYAKPSLAAAAAKAGDTVQIDPGVYESDACTWSADNLVLRAGPAGSKQRAHLKSNGANAQGKAIWVIDGKNALIENIEFSGAKVPDQNGAGIRQEAPGATIRNCFFHDNENGILGMGSDLVIEYTEFAHNGLGERGYTHNIYVSEGTSFTLRYCYSHHAVIGHNVKSRADRNFILYNRIMDEADGTSSYDIDLPEGGVAVILGNAIQQGPETDNSTIVAYGAEGVKKAVNELYVVNNTVVNDRPAGTFFSISGAPAVSKFYGNLYVGQGTIYSGAVKDTAGNVVTQNPGFVDRAGFDYHLTAGSPALDKAKDAGTGAGMPLAAASQYVHPLGRMDRTAVGGKPDAGAFEYGLNAPVRPRKATGARAPRPGLSIGGLGFHVRGTGPAYNGVGAVVRLPVPPAAASARR
jgi:hypothetical protein